MVKKPSVTLLILKIMLNSRMASYPALSANRTVSGNSLFHQYDLLQSFGPVCYHFANVQN